MTREEWLALGRAPIVKCEHENDARRCLWCWLDHKYTDEGGEA